MTNIWAWTWDKADELRERGEGEFAALFQDVSSLALAGNTAATEAAYEAALAKARALDEPWVEVYLRHWRLQNLLCEDVDLRKAMPEAAALIEFSSRPETRDCPQSICAVQDFCIAFGAVDGPGYADERIDIALDTMARIEPRRQCYGCLTTELVDAYIDKGEAGKAIAFLETEGPHVKAGMTRYDFNREYMLAAAAIAMVTKDLAELERHGVELRDAFFGMDSDKARGRGFVAVAQAQNADTDVRKAAILSLEPWQPYLTHRSALDIGLEAITQAFEHGWPEDVDAVFWANRLRDGCVQLATDGKSSVAVTRAIRVAPLIARVLGRDQAIDMLARVEPELARLKQPERLAPQFEKARSALG